jgi:hypothetical protein
VVRRHNSRTNKEKVGAKDDGHEADGKQNLHDV